MPFYLIIDGKKQERDEDIFDQMVESLNQPTVQEPHSQHPPDGDLTGLMTANRWTPNVFLNTINKKISTPFKCPDCGRTISSKSNLFKHRQTNIL
jgi:hypothetical protein